MSPRNLKRPRVAKGALALDSANAARSAPPATPRLREEDRRARELWMAESRRVLKQEMQAALKAETEKIRREVEADWAGRLNALEPELVRVILCVAERVCRQTSAASPEGVLEWVREGLRVLGAGERRVRVHAGAVSAVQGMPETAAAGVSVSADEALSPGDVLIDNGGAQWDARLETRLEELERQFLRMADEAAREPG